MRKAGINPHNAKKLEVLVHGASGGLGQLAIQLLVRWGAGVTAICSTPNVDTCRKLGATSVWDRKRQPLADLPQRYDATLNFGAWQDEERLIGSLKQGALGCATAVHPLLDNFDTHGWLAGAWRTRHELRRVKSLAAAKGAGYGWVIFKPEEEALEELHGLLSQGALVLPVGITAGSPIDTGLLTAATAISTAARPTSEWNAATSSGICVICTRLAMTAPMAPPTTMPAKIIPTFLVLE